MVSRRTLAVAVLLLVAGCSGLSSDDGPPDRTPYDVDDELEPTLPDATNGSEDLVPGLTSAGVENASLLVDRHYEALGAANGTYVVVVRETETIGDDTPVRVARRRYVVSSPERWYRWAELPHRPDAEPTISEFWVAGEARLVRESPPNGPVEYRSVAHEEATRPLEEFLRSVVAEATDATVEERADDGTTRYRVSATADSNDSGGLQTVAFTVGSDGIVDEVTYDYRFDRGSREGDQFESVVAFDVDGPASLERPDWYEAALEATDGDASSNATADDGSELDGGTDGGESGGEEMADTTGNEVPGKIVSRRGAPSVASHVRVRARTRDENRPGAADPRFVDSNG